MAYEHNEHVGIQNAGTAFAVATTLNIAIVLLQVGAGFFAHSTALLADAMHNAGDVLGLFLAWGAFKLAQRKPTNNFTYGMGSGTVLAAMFNGMFLLVATGAIAWEAVQRFFEPTPIEPNIVMAVAALAIVLNGLSAWLLSRGHKEDINVRSAFWHLVSDAAVSVGVVIAAFLIRMTGLLWIDPLASLIIALVILKSTWGLLREALRLSFQAVPASVNIEAVRSYLNGIEGVERVHDLHVWPISTTEVALTCHFRVNDRFDANSICKVSEELEHRFKIGHSTIQLEDINGDPCKLATGI